MTEFIKYLDIYLTWCLKTIHSDIFILWELGYWNFTIILPAILVMYIILKTSVITIPLWLPIKLVLAPFSEKVKRNKLKKSENDRND
jgi:hypothetical protein